MKKALLIFLTLAILENVHGQSLLLAPPFPKPDDRYKADILLIVAHPDDETAIGSYLAKAIFDLQKRVAIVYCTKGSGGGNSYGVEQSQAMAAMREIESRRAVAELGIHNVWFVDGEDTPGQDVLHSLQNWGHGEVLEQVVRLVRLTRPEVILTWLPHYVAGENHGDHQAAGVIATEAFDLAGDPTVFPAQVAAPREAYDINNFTEGLRPWQPKKIYYFSDASHPIAAPGPPFDISEISSSRNVPYYQLAAPLHTYYLTQGANTGEAAKAIKSGDYEGLKSWLAHFKLIFGKSVVPCQPTGDVFDGIHDEPVPHIGAIAFRPPAAQGVTLSLGGAFAFYRDFWRAHNIEHLGPLVAPEMEVAAGSYVHIPLLLRNATPDTVMIDLTSTAPPGWKESSGSARYRLAPGEVYPVQTFFFASEEVESTGEVIWQARVAGKIIGSVVVKVTVKEWTLPQ